MTGASFGTAFPVLFTAIRITIVVTLISAAVATLLGLLVALCRLSHFPPLHALAFLYTQLFRGIALYVLLGWIWFGLALAIGLKLEAEVAGIVALSLLNSAYLSEIFRGSIQAVDHGQRDAALALGLCAPSSVHLGDPAAGVPRGTSGDDEPADQHRQGLVDPGRDRRA